MKVCVKCQARKPLNAFCKHRLNKDGLNRQCKRCAREQFVKLAEDSPGIRWKYKLKSRFGLRVEDYYQILSAQNGGCSACGEAPKAGKKLCVDHNHKTGKVRGLLCFPCNVSLGALKEDPNRIRGLLAYSEKCAAIKNPV